MHRAARLKGPIVLSSCAQNQAEGDRVGRLGVDEDEWPCLGSSVGIE